MSYGFFFGGDSEIKSVFISLKKVIRTFGKMKFRDSWSGNSKNFYDLVVSGSRNRNKRTLDL